MLSCVPLKSGLAQPIKSVARYPDNLGWALTLNMLLFVFKFFYAFTKNKNKKSNFMHLKSSSPFKSYDFILSFHDNQCFFVFGWFFIRLNLLCFDQC